MSLPSRNTGGYLSFHARKDSVCKAESIIIVIGMKRRRYVKILV
jgi:hypothetical protein